jgi:hypothetical protein
MIGKENLVKIYFYFEPVSLRYIHVVFLRFYSQCVHEYDRRIVYSPLNSVDEYDRRIVYSPKALCSGIWPKNCGVLSKALCSWIWPKNCALSTVYALLNVHSYDIRNLSSALCSWIWPKNWVLTSALCSWIWPKNWVLTSALCSWIWPKNCVLPNVLC